MDLSQLHVAHSVWLWLLVVIPLVWSAYFLYYRQNSSFHYLEKFIDSHLLPYLLVDHFGKHNSPWKTLLLWSVVWSFLVLALAGPRWNFREIETFSKDQSLVVLLDLSESMNATDVRPSRLVRAKQKIEDLLNLSKGVKIGLIAFAADSHMITPITDDKETVRHLLPSLGTDLISVQGSRLAPALTMAEAMLKAEPGNNQALLLISDGGFEDANAINDVKKLAAEGVVIHTMGMGTVEGAPLRDHEGNMIKKNGSVMLSKLEKERLREISRVGNGRYLNALYSDDEESAILNELTERAEAQMELGKKNRLWEEHFYMFIFPALPFILLWFRRGYLFTVFLLFLMPLPNLQAYDLPDYFKNADETAKQALNEGDYEAAANTFQDSYRKGVAYYRAGNFSEAEKMFRQSSRPEVASQASYNLGNSLVQQQKLKEALTAYENVLKKWPDHKKAQENLELVKKMLEQQKQDPSKSDQNKEQKDNQDKEQKDSQDKDQDKQENQENDQEKQDKDDDEKDQEKQSENENQDHQGDQNSDNENSDRQDDQKKSEEKEQEPADQPEESEKEENNSQDVQEAEEDSQGDNEPKSCRSQADQDADLWLNRLVNDPKKFLQNKFYLESKNNGTTQGMDPW